MAATMPELRTPVMIFVEAAWEDEKGNLQTSRACMEDKSARGACIRLKASVAPGSKIRIQWRFEEFFGIVKYCRSEGRDFLVGIQRDNTIQFRSVHAPLPQSQSANAEVKESATEIEKNGVSSESHKLPAKPPDVAPRIPPRGFGVQSARRRPQGRDRPRSEEPISIAEPSRPVDVLRSEPPSEETPKPPERNKKR